VLCSGTIRAAPFAHTISAAGTAGFQGVSLYYNEYAIARAEGWSDADMRGLLDDNGVAVAELDGRMDWLPGDWGAPSAADFVAAAAALGARSITVLETRGRRVGTDVPLDVVVRAFAALCDRAADHGLLAHLEYFPWSGIDTFATAHEIARNADRGNGGVMVDVWHHLRGRDAGAIDFVVGCSSVLAVQVSDVATERHDDLRAEARHARVLPGQGAGDTVALLRALREQGCTAPMEVEVYSDELTRLPPAEAARRAGDALRAVLVEAGLRERDA
jgi:sugar phosphate isomerase/epimerase